MRRCRKRYPECISRRNSRDSELGARRVGGGDLVRVGQRVAADSQRPTKDVAPLCGGSPDAAKQRSALLAVSCHPQLDAL